jgi:hypothetical protein
LRIYVDGVLRASGASSASLPDTTAVARAGDSPDSTTQRFEGDLDEIAVYLGALSAAQVADHYAAATS